MRKYIPNAVALEQEALANVPVLSLEEEAIETAEQTQEAGEIANELNEADRALDISDALEDLALIADGIETATPAEAALVESVGQMAVAGSDVSPEEVVPAMESFVGTKIATEGIRETAHALWQRVQEFVKKIWERIEAFVYRIFGTIPRLRRSIGELEDKIGDIGGKQADGKIKISSGLVALSSDNSPITNDADVRKGLGDLITAAKFVYGDSVDYTVARGKIVEAALKDFDATKAGEAVTEMRVKLKDQRALSVPGAGSADKARFPSYETRLGTGLLGNKSLAVKIFAENGDSTDLGALERYRHSGIELVASSEKAMEVRSAEIEPLSVSGMKDSLKLVTTLLDTLEDYRRGAKGKALDAQAKAIRSASDAAAKKAGAAKVENPSDERILSTQLTAMLNMNKGYTNWAYNPAVPFMGHALMVARSVMVLVQKSAAAYKEAK